MALLRILKARDIERLENTSFAALQLPVGAEGAVDLNGVSDRACSHWSCSGGELCCATGTVTASAVPTECSWTGACETQNESCGSCSGGNTCCITATGSPARSVVNCDPTTECTTIFTAMLPTPIDELLRQGGGQAAPLESVPVDPQAPLGWKL